jgi:hypothetical protein
LFQNQHGIEPFPLCSFSLGKRTQRKAYVCINLNFGFLSSESAEIFDELAFVSSKGIAEGPILSKKQRQDCEKIADSERIKPKVQVINA